MDTKCEINMESLEYFKSILNELSNLIEYSKKLPREYSNRVLTTLNDIKNRVELIMREISIDNVELAKFLKKELFDLHGKLEASTRSPEKKKETLEYLAKLRKHFYTAVYDFTDRFKYVRRAYRAYLLGMALYYIISGIFGTAYAITALILIIPVILAMGNIRKRRAISLTYIYVTTPMPLIIGALTIRYGLYALSDEQEIARIINELGVSVDMAYIIITLLLITGFTILALIIYAIIELYRNRAAFI